VCARLDLSLGTGEEQNFMTRSISKLFLASFLALCLTIPAGAQGYFQIDAGTTITVRTNESIDVDQSDSRVFTGTVAQDVTNGSGNIIIPRGSDVELVVKETSNDDIALDLQSVTVNGQRYSVESSDQVVTGDRKEGIGVNKRTGKYVGGGALLGAVIGAVTGGGKGAAIGAGVGAAAGAGAQVLTRGKSVRVPAESLVTFRLDQPLRTGYSNTSYSQNGRYKPYSYRNTPAYRAGLQAGRSDADRNLRRDERTTRWSSSQDKADYRAGYNDGYNGELNNGSSSYGTSSVHIGRDNNISWQAPTSSRVYVQVDNNPSQLFAEAPSGTQAAPWIEPGHVYLFVLRDMNGNELARDRLDTRKYRANRYR
jgi:hypothetical protein